MKYSSFLFKRMATPLFFQGRDRPHHIFNSQNCAHRNIFNSQDPARRKIFIQGSSCLFEADQG